MPIDQRIASHYAHGSLAQAIRAALVEAGKDPERLSPDDLAPVDEFHIGGRRATADLAAQLGLAADMRVLDIGSGIGGAARHMAQVYGCRVTGIDISADYVAVARWLSQAVGLADRIDFREGSATALPFEPASFDAATMLHVGMNIADKAGLMAGVARVLRPGGVFAIYDVMRRSDDVVLYPLPWAAGADTSFLAREADYRAAAAAAGFAVRSVRDRTAFAIEFFQRQRGRAAAGSAPALGIHILMGPDAALKRDNMLANLERGIFAPVEMICAKAQ